jgi:hypothetical protein
MSLNFSARSTITCLMLLVTLGIQMHTPALATTSPVANERVAVELTFLKSLPGQRENLKQSIVQNWFAMDKIAKAQGLMSAFTVMDTGSDEGPWNVLVSVTYMNERGYEGIAEAFEKIRRAHIPVGKSSRELGTIVDSKKMFENPSHATR